MAFSGTGKIWMNGRLVEWKDANIHIATHVIHYGSARVRRRALLCDAEGLRLLPPRRAHAPPAALRQDLPDGVRARPRRLERRGARDDPRQRDEGLLHPPDPLSRLRFARRQSAQLPGRRRDHAVGMGCLSRQGSARAGYRRQDFVVVADGAQHAAGDGQERRQLRQLGADQDGSHRRRLRRGDRARRLRQHQRRQRPEHLHGARRRDLHAAARLVDPRRHHPRLGDDAGARPRLYRQRVGDPARSALHRRRDFLRRHGRRGHPGPLGRQAADRRRPARAGHAGAAAGVLRRHQRRRARHARLAHIRVPVRELASRASEDRAEPRS